jgi:hypothetical protein
MSPTFYLGHDTPKYRHIQSLNASEAPAGEATGIDPPLDSEPGAAAAWAGMAAGSNKATDMVTAARIRVLRVMRPIVASISGSQQVLSYELLMFIYDTVDSTKGH